MSIREAAVAGTFYEADETRLRQHILSLLTGADQRSGIRPKALIVPHAGYQYSGAIAAQGYNTLAAVARDIERVVLLGPAHRVALQGMAIPTVEAFATPLAAVSIDRQSLQQCRALPDVCISDEAHRLEHSLEVQLPFLQLVLGDFSLVPVVIGQCARQSVADLVDALWGGRETLLIVSTDLSHFHSYEDALARDASTCQHVINKEAVLNGNDACGATALNGLLSSVHCQSLSVEQLAVCNSADTSGGKDRVVGYGAFFLH